VDISSGQKALLFLSPRTVMLISCNGGVTSRSGMLGNWGSRSKISCLVPEIFAIKVGRCVKSTKNLAGVKNFRGGPAIFWTYIKKIGRRSSEILWMIKKTSRLKQKAFQNYRSGRPKKGCSVAQEAAERVCCSGPRLQRPSIQTPEPPTCRSQARDFQLHPEPVPVTDELIAIGLC